MYDKENLKKEAIKRGIVEEIYFQEADAKAQKVVQEAVEFAANSPEPEIEELYEDVFCKECENALP